MPCAIAISQVQVPMNMHERFAAPEAILVGAETAGPTSWLRSLRTCVARWAKTFSDCWVAAAAYDDLSRLSDTQLKHRGLSRDILARDLGEWHG
jgi:hypothetical protein